MTILAVFITSEKQREEIHATIMEFWNQTEVSQLHRIDRYVFCV